jgi:hypothetical protein
MTRSQRCSPTRRATTIGQLGRSAGWMRSRSAPTGAVSSWAGAMIRSDRAGRSRVQLPLDLAESPAPAAALWELLGEEQRRAAMTLLAALMAQTVAGEEVDHE